MTDSVLIHRFFRDNLSMAEALNYNYSQVRNFFLQKIHDDPAAFGIVDRDARVLLASVLQLITPMLPQDEPQRHLKAREQPKDDLLFKGHGQGFPMLTLFDFIGWIFSVAHTQALAAGDLDNYYHQLAKIYLYFCRTLSPAGTGRTFTVALAYFENSNERQCALGAYGGNFDPRKTIRDKRVQALLEKAPQLKDEPLDKELFGKCAETWFFYLVIDKLPLGLTTAHGLALHLQLPPGGDNPEGVRIIPPCSSCTSIMKFLGLNRSNFLPPEEYGST